MKSIEVNFNLSSNNSFNLADLSIIMQAVFIEWLPDEWGDKLHQQSLKPYRQTVLHNEKDYTWHLDIFDEELSQSFILKLMEYGHKEIELERLGRIKIIDYQIKEINIKEFADVFYENRLVNSIDIKFLTSTSFKHEGQYAIFPDIHLIIQSLYQKYNHLMEEESVIDYDVLASLEKVARIQTYNLRSKYYPIHGIWIPSFVGNIKLKFHQQGSLTNYVAMLLTFGQYSGLGIKTAMGMGYIKVTINYKEVR